MNFTELREINDRRAIEWTGETEITGGRYVAEMLFRSTELGGECGEALNVVKKLGRLYLAMPGAIERRAAVKQLADELADTIISVDRLASLFDIDLSDAVRTKFNATSDKHGFVTRFTLSEDDLDET